MNKNNAAASILKSFNLRCILEYEPYQGTLIKTAGSVDYILRMQLTISFIIDYSANSFQD